MAAWLLLAACPPVCLAGWLVRARPAPPAVWAGCKSCPCAAALRIDAQVAAFAFTGLPDSYYTNMKVGAAADAEGGAADAVAVPQHLTRVLASREGHT
jgi:hypothetical protein